mmetsp:Transcript_23484/g.49227  ORF Transcript_23484/g.49227 Transcript_23484/m.49227 type:complete len:226 (-) Transcript_23484:41-718(-)
MPDDDPCERLPFSQEPLSASSRPSRSPQPYSKCRDPPSLTPSLRNEYTKRISFISSTGARFNSSPVSSVPLSSATRCRDSSFRYHSSNNTPTSRMEKSEARTSLLGLENEFLKLFKKYTADMSRAVDSLFKSETGKLRDEIYSLKYELDAVKSERDDIQKENVEMRRIMDRFFSRFDDNASEISVFEFYCNLVKIAEEWSKYRDMIGFLKGKHNVNHSTSHDDSK